MFLSPDLDYFNRLARLNGLAGSAGIKAVFTPGMLFDSRQKWWSGQGQRQTAHEGLDFCFFRKNRGPIQAIGSGWKIAVIWPGHVAGICNDYLGQTVILSHGRLAAEEGELLSLYAHLQPAQWVAPGRYIGDNQIAGAVAGVDPRRSTISPHLHISLAWNERPFSYGHLQWSQLSRRQGVVFVDPLTRINAGRVFSIEPGTTEGVK